MTFVWPWMLALAILPLAAAGLTMLPHRRGADDARALPAVLRATIGGNRVRVVGRRDTVARRPWRLWFAALAIVVALARPQWGAPEAGMLAPGQLVIALDLSRSMLADDALPSRLERARALATRLVEARPSDRIGLVGFAGDAFLLAPPSEDRAVLRAFLPTIGPEHMPRPGSDFARLIEVAGPAFDRDVPGARTLVLLSDGEAEPTAWRDRLGILRRAGVRVVAVGIGTAAGKTLAAAGRPIEGPSGRPVVSRLQPAALKALASATGGTYLDAARAGDLLSAVADATGRAPPGEAGNVGAPERFRLFVALALLLLGWSIAVEWPALPRLRRVERRGPFAAVATLGALLAALPMMQAGAVPRIDPELHGMEPDPLIVMKKVVGDMLAKPTIRADDYQALADTAVRYGEVHRGHAHPLELGVLRDGLAAIAQGERLDPRREAWKFDRGRLIRLLEPPKMPGDQGTKPGDPADDPADAQGKKPNEGDAEQDKQKKDQAEKQADRDKRTVGGSKRDVYDQAEWRVASLVRPLSLLQHVRERDSTAELFRLSQAQQARPPRRSGQSW